MRLPREDHSFKSHLPEAPKEQGEIRNNDKAKQQIYENQSTYKEHCKIGTTLERIAEKNEKKKKKKQTKKNKKKQHFEERCLN